MFLFFLLGLLATPSELPNVALIGFLIALFLTIVARPLAVLISMLFFHLIYFGFIIMDNKRIIPNGNTILNGKDILIMSGKDSGKIEGINLYEMIVDSSDELINRKIKDISINNKLIILIKRKNSVIIPKGDTVIYDGDILVINDTK